MTLDEVLKGLTNGLKYSQERLLFIRFRLNEIRREYNLTLEKLNEYCTADSCEMFSVIFDHKALKPENFVCS